MGFLMRRSVVCTSSENSFVVHRSRFPQKCTCVLLLTYPEQQVRIFSGCAEIKNSRNLHNNQHTIVVEKVQTFIW